MTRDAVSTASGQKPVGQAVRRFLFICVRFHLPIVYGPQRNFAEDREKASEAGRLSAVYRNGNVPAKR
ncbi:general stress protein [Klebsiella quasipneumoniae]|uniref:general stress protein n=1 Tax=Klebsiella quasipneumoniae TaxID=1463165 RepID=UPI0023E13554|nr:KGG domain-containing protein [Klebsiella quasipneumoniae]